MVALNFDATQVPNFQQDNFTQPNNPEYRSLPWPADCKLSDDERSSYMANSTYFGVMDTVEKVIKHWEIVHQYRAQQAQLQFDEEQAKLRRQKYSPIVTPERQEHKLAVAQAKKAWRDAVFEARQKKYEIDANVKALHDAFVKLRDGV